MPMHHQAALNTDRSSYGVQSRAGEGAGGRCTARLALLALLVMAGALVGCSGYQLQGKAIEGPTSAIFIVDQDDPRLQEPGLAGAVVDLTLDPDRLSSKPLGSDVSDLDGHFAIAVDEFGAGMLEYRARLVARMRNHRSIAKTFMLPGNGKRVLLVLAEGDDTVPPAEENVLDETMRLGEPYMSN